MIENLLWFIGLFLVSVGLGLISIVVSTIIIRKLLDYLDSRKDKREKKKYQESKVQMKKPEVQRSVMKELEREQYEMERPLNLSNQRFSQNLEMIADALTKKPSPRAAAYKECVKMAKKKDELESLSDLIKNGRIFGRVKEIGRHFCPFCGSMIDDLGIICPYCGSEQKL